MSDYIPPELIPNILARLAVKDVLRCTSVCKSWYSLITSPSFTFSHINLSSPNQEPRLLIKYWKRKHSGVVYYLHRDSQTFDEIAKLDLPSGFRYEFLLVTDCLNGLVCLYDTDSKVVLWNPALRRYLNLPKPRMLPCTKDYTQTVGFGFVPSSNEYKIVRFICSPSTDFQGEIYEQSTGSWRDLPLGDYSDVNLCGQQAHFKGILHWYARSAKKLNPTAPYFIYSFDLENEKHGTLMVPSCWRHDDEELVVLSTFRESLCLIDDTSYKFCEIWALREYGVADSWAKLFIVDKENSLISFCSFRQNWEILFEKYDKRVSELVSYNVMYNQVKNVGIRSPTLQDIFAFTYVESLVLIDVPNE